MDRVDSLAGELERALNISYYLEARCEELQAAIEELKKK